jgi:hypothetical protein
MIKPNRNVGIRNSNPSNIFQVGNAGRLRISNADNDYTLIGTADTDGATNTRIVISGNTRGGYAGNIEYVSTSYGSHIFYTTNSTTERMRIKDDGNVGIGNNNPQYKLDVNGNLNVNGDIIINGNLHGGHNVAKKIYYGGSPLTPSYNGIYLVNVYVTSWLGNGEGGVRCFKLHYYSPAQSVPGGVFVFGSHDIIYDEASQTARYNTIYSNNSSIDLTYLGSAGYIRITYPASTTIVVNLLPFNLY